MSSNSRSKSKGFTLIEVMIAMAILAFIALGIFQAVTETFKLRDVLTNEGDFYNAIRMSMDILQRDVGLMYSPTMMMPEQQQAQQKQDGANGQSTPQPLATNKATSPAGQDQPPTSQFWEQSEDSTGIRPSRFIGTESKLSFISASHIRIYRDSRESELAKVSYELIKDTGNPEMDAIPELKDTNVLLKTESTDVFNDDESKDKLKHKYPLLHGIKKLTYRYYRKDKDSWLTSWDSDQEDTKNQYPDIVEVTVEVVGPSQLSFTGIYQFRPEVPLRGLDPST